MYVKKKENVCVVEGRNALAIYDFNSEKLYRVGLEAKELFDNFRLGNKVNINNIKAESVEFIEECVKLELLEYSSEVAVNTIKENIDEFIEVVPHIKFCWLEITSKCNQRCLHCFMGEELNKKELPLEVIEKVIEDLAMINIDAIALSGGEPTLHTKFPQIIKTLIKRNIPTVVLTNGLNLDEELLTLLKHPNIHVRVPLLGIGKTHDLITNVQGAYERVIRNIELLKSNKINLSITSTVMELNKNDMEGIKKITDSLNLPFTKSPIYPIGKAKDNWGKLVPDKYEYVVQGCNDFKSEYIEQLHSNDNYIKIKTPISRFSDCGAKNIAISWQGDYIPCLLLRDKEFFMGSVLNNPITQLISLQNSEFERVQGLLSYEKIKPCNSCETRYLCKGGGCRAVSYLFKGNIQLRNPYFANCYYKCLNYEE